MDKHNFESFKKEINTITCELDYKKLKILSKLLKQKRIKNKSIFFIGNGGSASLASHLAADIGKNTSVKKGSHKKKRFKTFSLCDNMAWITALSNDLAFEDIFVEQLKSVAKKGDMLIVITGSGNSKNVIKAVKWARNNGITTFGLLGFDGGKVKILLDNHWIINSFSYEVVESVHGTIHHLLVEDLKY